MAEARFGGRHLSSSTRRSLDSRRVGPHAQATSTHSCVCIELYTGDPPFQDLAGRQVQRHVVTGKRPPRPLLMFDNVWNLTEACWSANPTNRPSFHQIARNLARISLAPFFSPYGRYRMSGMHIYRILEDLAQSKLGEMADSLLLRTTACTWTEVHVVIRTFMTNLDFVIFTEDELNRCIGRRLSKDTSAPLISAAQLVSLIETESIVM